MVDRSSLATLRSQYQYELDVHVRQGEKLTGGFNKTIYKAQWIDRKGQPIVLLEIKGNDASKDVYLYISLEHKHIIKTYGLVKPSPEMVKRHSVLLLQEYAKDGDLGRMLSGHIFIPSQNVLLEIFIQIADAMIYLSKNNIIHGDLACRNVVVFKTNPNDPKGNLVKLIDFGLTQDKSKSSNAKIDVPERYAAREIILSNGRSGYSEKSDVYSFGVLMWEACSPEKTMPYEHISDDKEVCKRKLDGEKLTKPKKCDSNIWTLMLKCWNDIADERPTFQQIHRQLKAIQNSDTSLSSTNDQPLFLVNTESMVCRDCGIRYTNYDSHQRTCTEQILTCYVCQEVHRRASYQDHRETCRESSPSASSDDRTEEEILFPCQFCQTQFDRNALNDHQESCPMNPQNRRKSSNPESSQRNSNRLSNNRNSSAYQSNDRISSGPNRNTNTRLPSVGYRSRIRSVDESDEDEPFPRKRLHLYQGPVESPPRTSIRKKSLPSAVELLPCEICEVPIDITQFFTHQQQCLAKDQQRVEQKRTNVENQQITENVPCQYCNRVCSINELNNHESNCPSNPMKVNGRKFSLSQTDSNSLPDLRRLPFSTEPIDKNSPGSTNDLGTKKIDDKKNREPSSFRKFVSRLWPRKKKV